jgi:nucleoside-diphosphate-sugar epimerase
MILLTGCAGFIGARVAEILLEEGRNLLGVDDLNNYYDVRLKKWRAEKLKRFKNFKFLKADITDFKVMERIFKKNRIDVIYNLAARAGVRASIENPMIYFKVNVDGTLNLLELARRFGVRKFILSSSSSVYAGAKMPFREESEIAKPLSPYAASKRSGELIAYTYHHLYGLDIAVLRYFTVYGPAGRPDMSPFKFIKLINEGKELPVFGDGTQMRDFTYIDDIARGTVMAERIKGFEILNLGNNKPHSLNELIALIEKSLGKKAKIKNMPFDKSDMKSTWADIRKAKKLLGWSPVVSLEDGIKRTVEWFKKNEKFLTSLKI